MTYKIFLLLFQSTIFVNNYRFINTEAILGTRYVKSVDEYEFTSIACLMRNIPENEVNRNIYCTATFISLTHLLSTASCVDDNGEIGFVVNAGSHDVRLGHMYSPLWWLTYDKFAEIYKLPYNHPQNDISIIRLAEPVNNITPAPISKVEPDNLSGQKVKILGCGLSCAGEPSMIKMKANVKIMSNMECSYKDLSHQEQINPVPKYLLCSSYEPGVLLATGDFGGPLLLNGEIVAVNIGATAAVGETTELKRKNYHLSIEDYQYFIDFNLCI